MTLELAPEAQLDIAEACDWYENRRVGLGLEFLDAIAVLLTRPQTWAEVV